MRNSHKWARIDKYAVRGAMRWVFNNQHAARALGEFVLLPHLVLYYFYRFISLDTKCNLNLESNGSFYLKIKSKKFWKVLDVNQLPYYHVKFPLPGGGTLLPAVLLHYIL